MTVIRRHRWLQGLLLLGPAAVWALVFIVAPTCVAVYVSLSQIIDYKLVHDLTLDSYQRFFEEPIFGDALVRSLKNGVIVAVLAVALSVPIAHFISFRVKRHQFAWFASVVVALWLGYLLRVIGWRILLGRDGVINDLLMSTGIADEPVSFLVFSPFSVILAQTHLAMPFAFIPIFVIMQRVPRNLFQAAGDLGASRWRQILHVELPLIVPGLVIGATFAFVLAFGDYFAPDLVGNPASVAIGNLASNQFNEALAWPLGAAIGVVMTITVLLVVAVPALTSWIYRKATGIRVGAELRAAARQAEAGG